MFGNTFTPSGSGPFKIPWGAYRVISPLVATGIPYSTTINYNTNFIEWSQAIYVIGPNDGLNYWTLDMIDLNNTVNYSTFNSNLIAANVWGVVQNKPLVVSSFLSSKLGLVIVCTKIGAPGGLFVAGPDLTAI